MFALQADHTDSNFASDLIFGCLVRLVSIVGLVSDIGADEIVDGGGGTGLGAGADADESSGDGVRLADSSAGRDLHLSVILLMLESEAYRYSRCRCWLELGNTSSRAGRQPHEAHPYPN